MRIVASISWFLYRIIAVYTIVVMLLIYLALSSHWIAGFMMMSFPVIIIINIIFLLLFILTNRKRALVPAAVLAISLLFLPRTYGFNKKNEQEAVDPKGFKIMNYNVHEFNPYPEVKNEESNQIQMMLNWIMNSEADVLCMPEYRTVDGNPVLRVNSALSKKGYKYSRFLEAEGNHNNYRGLAVFSKYPIVRSREKSFAYLNGMLQADIKINRDTVRVIAIHLYSMTLRLNKFAAQREADGVKKEGKVVFDRIKSGFVGHAREFKELESWIKESPYPTIVCGDFNETPYSYVYGQTRNLLTNAFEEKGKGFGFTYNHLPSFIRIDHQFYDRKKLDLLQFETIDSVKYSDHYPLMGTYRVIKN